MVMERFATAASYAHRNIVFLPTKRGTRYVNVYVGSIFQRLIQELNFESTRSDMSGFRFCYVASDWQVTHFPCFQMRPPFV